MSWTKTVHRLYHGHENSQETISMHTVRYTDILVSRSIDVFLSLSHSLHVYFVSQSPVTITSRFIREEDVHAYYYAGRCVCETE
jgi:hypothetical protein